MGVSQWLINDHYPYEKWLFHCEYNGYSWEYTLLNGYNEPMGIYPY